jgi:hypothetical protein
MSPALAFDALDCLHYVRTFRHARDRNLYRAECSCGQAREGDRDAVNNWAAGHDLAPVREDA